MVSCLDQSRNQQCQRKLHCDNLIRPSSTPLLAPKSNEFSELKIFQRKRINVKRIV